MTRFLVEAYAPVPRSMDEIGQRARLGAAEISSAGASVRYVRSIFVPEDETYFHLFEAGSADSVRAASERAGLEPHRIVEALT